VKISAYLFLYSFISCSIACSHPATGIEGLKANITRELQQQKGAFSVAFKDLSSGQELFLHEHESFHAASTMKTPVMIEIYRQSAAGRFSLSDSILIKNEFKSIADSSLFRLDTADDSELELYKHLGEKRPIDSLLSLMITRSSNLSTNLLIELAGAKNVQQTMRELGAKDIRVLRGVEDNKAYEKGMNNTVSAYDLALIFEKMARGELLSAAASKDMIRILLGQTFNEIIPAQLPPEVRVAHKTGWFKSVNHDGGIVFLPDGRKYVLVLLSKNVEKDADAVAALAGVSKSVYDFEMRHKK
jgi:beta-lactamase class A